MNLTENKSICEILDIGRKDCKRMLRKVFYFIASFMIVGIVNIDCLFASTNKASYCSYCKHGTAISDDGGICKFCGHERNSRGKSRSDESFGLSRSYEIEGKVPYILDLSHVEFYKDQNASGGSHGDGVHRYPEDDWREYRNESSYYPEDEHQQGNEDGYQLKLGKNLLSSANDHSDEDWKDEDFGGSEEDEEGEGDEEGLEEEDNGELQLPDSTQTLDLNTLPSNTPVLPEIPGIQQQLPVGIGQQDMLTPLPTIDYQQMQQGQMLPDYTYPTTLNTQNSLQSQDQWLSQNGLYGQNGLQSMPEEPNGRRYGSNRLDPQVEAAVVNETIEYLKSVGVINEQILSKMRAGMTMGVCIACPSDRGVQYVYQIGAQNGGGLCEHHLQAVYDGQLSSNYNGSGGLGGALERGLRSAFGVEHDRNEAFARDGLGYNTYGSHGNNGSSQGSSESNSENGLGQGLKSAALSLVSKLANGGGSGGLGGLFGHGNESASNSEVTTAAPSTGVAGTAEANGQMVLNASGQLVPFGSFSDPIAPYGYVRMPDGTLRPAASLQEALAAASAASAVPGAMTAGISGAAGIAGTTGMTGITGANALTTMANPGQMVLNSLGQLVPIGSFFDPIAPYGYVKMPDGTLRPATSPEEGAAAAAAAAGTAATMNGATTNAIAGTPGATGVTGAVTGALNTATSAVTSGMNTAANAVGNTITAATQLATAAAPLASLAQSVGSAIGSVASGIKSKMSASSTSGSNASVTDNSNHNKNTNKSNGNSSSNSGNKKKKKKKKKGAQTSVSSGSASSSTQSTTTGSKKKKKKAKK